MNLNPGHHEFPFQCQIPIQCPSSFEGGNGHVRYEVKAVVDRSMMFDQEKVATLTVIAGRDLNAIPYCKVCVLAFYAIFGLLPDVQVHCLVYLHTSPLICLIYVLYDYLHWTGLAYLKSIIIKIMPDNHTNTLGTA